MALREVEGDLLDQPVEVIGQCMEPLREVARRGPISLGGAVLTSAGKLPFRAIIHVAGIDMLWRASEHSIRGSTRSALEIVNRERFTSVAFPIIGAGSGGMSEERARALLLDELRKMATPAQVLVVRYRKHA